MNLNGDISPENPGAPFRIRGDWPKRARQLKERYPQLTEADVWFEPGNENELLSRMGKRLNKNRSEVISLIHKDQENIKQ